MKKFILTGAIFLSLCISSCTKDLSIVNQSFINGYFEYSYVNSACRDHKSGWIIDKSGNVKAYSYPSEWNLPDSFGYISQNKMNENLSLCKLILANVPIDTLSYYHSISRLIIADKFSEEVSNGYDAGSHSLYFYSFESISGKYKVMLLSQDGDWATYNLDNNAIKVTKWLKSIK